MGCFAQMQFHVGIGARVRPVVPTTGEGQQGTDERQPLAQVEPAPTSLAAAATSPS
jgi:hypothetical protein